MDIYSQHRLHIPATEPEHLLRKAELDSAVNEVIDRCHSDYSVPCCGQRIAVGGVIAAEPNGRASVQLLDSMGIPAGKVIRNVIMLPAANQHSAEIITDNTDLINRARKDNPLNEVEIV